jgi:Winged helix DNA-binding domain
MIRTVSVQQRRRAIVRRHHLGGDAESPEAVAQALIALHATDPASVYLSVLARSGGSTLADVSDAMYERRSLVRWMAMRRTLFVFPRADVPIVQAAVSTPLAAMLRRRLISKLERNGSVPPIDGDVGAWLTGLETRSEKALQARGTSTGAQLSTDEPALRTLIPARAPSDRPQNVTSALLTLMSAEGRIVRSTPTGSWTSRNHRWEPAGLWWPGGLPELGMEESQQALAHRWLACFGPATVDDLQWWTGWNKSTVRRAFSNLPIEEVDLHGETGIALHDLDDESGDHPPATPVATLLPSLDPTPMGWKHRDWFLGLDQHHVFDRNGNIGPTLWWDGEIVGSWAVTAAGELRTTVVADRGAAAEAAVQDAAARLHDRLRGAVVTPAIRAPLERSLAQGGAERYRQDPAYRPGWLGWDAEVSALI